MISVLLGFIAGFFASLTILVQCRAFPCGETEAKQEASFDAVHDGCFLIAFIVCACNGRVNEWLLTFAAYYATKRFFDLMWFLFGQNPRLRK